MLNNNKNRKNISHEENTDKHVTAPGDERHVLIDQSDTRRDGHIEQFELETKTHNNGPDKMKSRKVQICICFVVITIILALAAGVALLVTGSTVQIPKLSVLTHEVDNSDEMTKNHDLKSSKIHNYRNKTLNSSTHGYSYLVDDSWMKNREKNATKTTSVMCRLFPDVLPKLCLL
ncbi:unnamed protein product [Owenia fusiformis]|uniref:Uncharacterized protein n=1 Tax=Owenia fusiformis TaxID=6347 RepID=A0A8J1TM20_OWEFU|nr:unnamed protein product [Owenia fusiformis]